MPWVVDMAKEKRRNHQHMGGLHLDCQHLVRYKEGVDINQRVWCNKCCGLHAVLNVIPPKWLVKRVEHQEPLW